MRLLETPSFRMFTRHLGSPKAGHTAAIELVGEAFGPGVSYTHDPDGAPRLVPEQKGVFISVSHSRDTCVLATSNVPVGVDIEAPRGQLTRVAGKFMSPSELRRLEAQGTPLSPEALLPFWTAKEAVYKAACTPGLSLTEIEVDIENGHATARGRSYTVWYFTATDSPDSVIAVATEVR